MTHSSTINISSDRIIQWMNVIRDSSDVDQYRLLENFWASQLRSKAWIINTLKQLDLTVQGDVYVFGGWYGVLGSLIKDNFTVNNVYSIDIDPSCVKWGEQLDNRIIFITEDMSTFSLEQRSNIGLIINTSTEHVSQQVYDNWFDKIPTDVLVILQGNDFYSCQEHIRCTYDIEEFVRINKFKNLLFNGTLDCTQFTRFMTIGYKYGV